MEKLLLLAATQCNLCALFSISFFFAQTVEHMEWLFICKYMYELYDSGRWTFEINRLENRKITNHPFFHHLETAKWLAHLSHIWKIVPLHRCDVKFHYSCCVLFDLEYDIFILLANLSFSSNTLGECRVLFRKGCYMLPAAHCGTHREDCEFGKFTYPYKNGMRESRYQFNQLLIDGFTT